MNEKQSVPSKYIGVDKKQAIESVFMEPSIVGKTLTWIRSDLPQDPFLSYVIIFPRGRCICLRFCLDSNNQGLELEETRMVFTYCYSFGKNVAIQKLKYSVVQIISSFHNSWASEDRAIQRMKEAVERKIVADPHFLLQKVYASSVQEDFYKGIDAWMLYQGHAVPVQVKSSKYATVLHREAHPEIPVFLYTEQFSEPILLKNLSYLASRYVLERKFNTRSTV